MKLILNTHVDNAFFDGCCYAFLDLTPGLAQIILNRRDAILTVSATDSSAIAIEYYGCEPVFLDGLPPEIADDAEDIDLGDGNPFETSASVEDFENVAARTECDRMVITSDEVYWTCYPKNCDPKAETRTIDYDTIRRAAGHAAENSPAHCRHCGKPLTLHGRFARCSDGETQYEAIPATAPPQ